MEYTKANLYENLINKGLTISLDCGIDIFSTIAGDKTIYGIVDYSRDIEEWEIEWLNDDFNEFCEYIETAFKPTKMDIFDLNDDF